MRSSSNLRRYRLLLPLVLSVAATSPAFAEPAMEWVQKMSHAMQNLSYRGNFVYLHENQLESMQISHFRDETGVKERLISLNGEAREVLRDNHNLTCVWPTSRKVVVDVSRQNSFSPIFIPEDIARLERHYDIKQVGRDRVADMDTVVIHIDPRDEFRYGMKFWIHEDSNLMLKSSLMDENGREIEQVMFTSMKVFADGETLEFDTMPQIDENFTMVRYHYGENAGSDIPETGWMLEEMPSGFRRESVLRRNISGTDRFVEQMVYSDGLASLSVFIERLTDEGHSGGTSMGAVNAYIRIIHEHSVTAIGEVPAVTVRKIAESVSYQAQ